MKRHTFTFIIVTTLFLTLSAVLFKVSVLDHKVYTNAVINQRTGGIDVKKYRGLITDRNDIPLVDGRSYIYQLKQGADKQSYSEDDNEKKIVFNATNRYDDLSLSRHLIGYTDADDRGVSGLEKTFDTYLESEEKYRINTINDALDKSITEYGTRTKNANYVNDVNVRTTLNYHIQKIVETAMDKTDKNSSVVVLDIETFDIVAMASRPNFKQYDVTDYVKSNGTSLINRAVSGYNAGSVFKIITSAAALESGLADTDHDFLCCGFAETDGVRFNCLNTEGHGVLSMKRAFALSCNCCFLDLGIIMGGKSVCDMAKRFGFGRKILDVDIGECAGNIPEGELSKADSANISIGQGEILITPLQAANMVCIIANEGVVKKVNLIDAVVDEKGHIIEYLRKEEESRVISKSTADKIKEMMLEVTVDGTGMNALSPDIGYICGKTGSAETGWMGDDGELNTHAWFCGFYPYENPKYAMAVFVEDGHQGNTAAAPIFKEIAEGIENIY